MVCFALLCGLLCCVVCFALLCRLLCFAVSFALLCRLVLPILLYFYLCTLCCWWNMSDHDEFDSETDTLLSQIDDSEVQRHADFEDFKLTSAQLNKRFGKLVNNEEIVDIQQKGKCANTRKDTLWAVGVFNEWRRFRNEKVATNLGTTSAGVDISKDIYVFVPALDGDLSLKELDFWLCRFVLEANRQDGTPYPATTLKHICGGRLRQPYLTTTLMSSL